MDAVQLLVAQHRALEGCLQRLAETDDEARRAALLADVGDHLAVHIESEELVFYPAVHAGPTEGILLESLEEHLSLKRLLADLLELPPSEQTFEPKVKVLKEQTEHHHEEEEEHLFPKVRKLLRADELDALGARMLALQNRLRRAGDPRDVVADETDRAAPLE